MHSNVIGIIQLQVHFFSYCTSRHTIFFSCGLSCGLLILKLSNQKYNGRKNRRSGITAYLLSQRKIIRMSACHIIISSNGQVFECFELHSGQLLFTLFPSFKPFNVQVRIRFDGTLDSTKYDKLIKYFVYQHNYL